MPDDQSKSNQVADELCPCCGHSIDGSHDPMNYCLACPTWDDDDQEPCAFIYNEEGVAVCAG